MNKGKRKITAVFAKCDTKMLEGGPGER